MLHGQLTLLVAFPARWVDLLRQAGPNGVPYCAGAQIDGVQVAAQATRL